ncbi:MAG: hypothetical protein R6U28_05750 [Cyclonatronaceae bacterium]
MKKRMIDDRLKARLTDARDERLSEQEQETLKQEVMAHDPQLWKDHQWMMQESGMRMFQGISQMRDEQPADGAIHRFHQRREAAGGTGADLEFLVWNWFRRYVLTLGLLLIVLFTGLHLGFQSEKPGDTREQMTRFLGMEQEAAPELDHWLYEDL